jgi:hypothetical protein
MQINGICHYFKILHNVKLKLHHIIQFEKESDVARMSKLLRDRNNIIFILRHPALCF